ncbi:formate dehydrogenase accessory sulfurtransferase FdhD [Archaeoglobus veneficus]|uniref:Formate dehydrogenase family accessory protein FdhD n=1 Tax=Archaeoglobus veneficus (strain DSM 11195 / SNP6) TaxID=693661 RepID=F2KNC1_ARCVS|nr:formate dehydrogenase accessory sulfurtransferase FdhD [Archaeoglobus veneficus]AEA47323.1 formate dehydrogenase family accessory protein FdhD [Archaeoglobus veneficus SNP6]
MEIKKLGDTLEIAVERNLRVTVNDISFGMACTPSNIEELILGFMVTEGIANPDGVKVTINGENVEVIIEDDAKVKITSSGSIGIEEGELKRVNAGEKFGIDELKSALEYLEVEEYKRTRGYHIAAVVSKKGLEARAYDVGRHNAVDKAVGMCIKKGIALDRTFLLISGRISRGIAAKCVRAGIPLIVSKAAILDSAIELCRLTGLSAVSFATNIAVKGDALEI